MKSLILFIITIGIALYFTTQYNPTFILSDHPVDNIRSPKNSMRVVDVLLDFVGPLLKWVAMFFDGVRLKERYRIEGIQNPVDILIDNHGVPHVYAESDEDLFFGFGFAVASQRLWQIELNRRTCKGTLSEIFGEIALETDRILRALGFYRLSVENHVEDDVEHANLWLAYMNGINEYINQPDFVLPVEFKILGITPTNYTFTEMRAFSKMISWQLGKGWSHEIVRSYLVDKLGEKIAELDEVKYPHSHPKILQDVFEYNILDMNAEFDADGAPLLSQFAGSNSWVVSGEHTKSGKPILCNDPHLPTNTPSFWIEGGLHGPGKWNIYGVSIPFFPAIAIGHNERTAFGITLNFIDGHDLVIEKFVDDNHYEYKGDKIEVQIAEEKIYIKGREEPHTENVKITRNGPIISEVFKWKKPIALRSTYGTDSIEVITFAAIQNWDDFAKATEYFPPGLNFVYADIDGNIGYWATGKIPLRTNYEGILPIPGWTGEYEWTGFVPHNEMPHALNPKTGFFVTANNQIVEEDDYPYYVSKFYDFGWRAKRITELIEKKIEKKEKIGVPFLQTIQTDIKSLACVDFLGVIGKYKDQVLETLDKESAELFNQFFEFDCVMGKDSAFATVYALTRTYIIRNLFDDVLGRELGIKYSGQGLHPLLVSSNEWSTHDIAKVLHVLSNETSWFVEQSGGHVAVINTGFTSAIKWIKRELGNHTGDWQWGKIHTLTMHHSLGSVKPLNKILTVGPIPVGGDRETCKLAGHNSYNSFEVKGWSSHYRQCFDLADWSKGETIHIPGNSGNLNSGHYDDFVEDWLNGRYHPAHFYRQDIEKDLEQSVRLDPK